MLSLFGESVNKCAARYHSLFRAAIILMNITQKFISEKNQHPSSAQLCPLYAHLICCIELIHDRQQLRKLLEAHGWRLDRISGSHHIMIREGYRSIPIPIHGASDLPKGLLNAILKQSGIKE